MCPLFSCSALCYILLRFCDKHGAGWTTLMFDFSAAKQTTFLYKEMTSDWIIFQLTPPFHTTSSFLIGYRQNIFVSFLFLAERISARHHSVLFNVHEFLFGYQIIFVRKMIVDENKSNSSVTDPDWSLFLGFKKKRKQRALSRHPNPSFE